MNGALAGIRVIDLGRYIAAPWCGQILGDLGADVIKIERPGSGDQMRQAGPVFLKDAGGQDSDHSSFLIAANRNKRSLTLDIARAEGRDLLIELVRGADVLIENFRTGVLARYGLDQAALRVVNPRLIYCSITGYGQDGPLCDRPATDSQLQAMSGLMSLTGEAGGAPQKTGVTIVDLLTGVYATSAILAALHHRTVSGGAGQYIDMALFDTAVAATSHAAQDFLLTGEAPLRTGGVVPGTVAAQAFATRSGWINIQAQGDEAFRALCLVLGLTKEIDDPRFAAAAGRWRHRGELLPLIERACTAWDEAELAERLNAEGVMAAPVLTIDRALATEQALHRQVRRVSARADGVAVAMIANPIRLSQTPIDRYAPPPDLGEHSDEILRELGLDKARIDALRADGII